MNEEENYYESFEEEEPKIESNKTSKKEIGLIIGLIIISLALIAVLVILLIKRSNKIEFTLKENKATIYQKETYTIEYNLVDKNNTNNVVITSDDEAIATIDGNIAKGIKEGTTKINIVYIDSKGDTHPLIFYLTVLKKETEKTPEKKQEETKPVKQTKPTITTKFTQGGSNWVNTDVKIKVTATDTNGISNLTYKYAGTTNKIGSGNIITLNQNGANDVVITAKNKQGNTSTKTIKVKIDKIAPTVSLVNETSTYKGKGSVQVCAKCSDNDSGCTTQQVCNTYTQNAKNITLTVYDNAGNSTRSKAFAIEITK